MASNAASYNLTFRVIRALNPCNPCYSSLLRVDHLPRHAAVDNELRPGDEPALRADQPRRQTSDVVGRPHAPGRMERMILWPRRIALGEDPSRADAVGPHVRCKADRQRMRQRHQAALRCGVRL